MVCLKVLYLVLSCSSCTLLLVSALSFLTHLQIITSMQMTLNFSYLSAAPYSHNTALLETAISSVSNWTSANFLTLNPSKTEFLIIGLPHQLSILSFPTFRLPNNVTLSPVDSARNLGVILDKNLSYAHISSVSKLCFVNIRDLRRIRNMIDHTNAFTLATSLIHCKIDYCNSLLLKLLATQINSLQLVFNSAACAVT